MSSGSNSYRRAVSRIQSDRAVSTVDGYSRAVFTVNGNGAVCTFSRTVFAGFFTKGNRIAQAYGELTIGGISRRRSVAVTGNLNRLAQILFHSRAAVIGQAEATDCVFTGAVDNGIANSLQLIFRSCPTGYDIRIGYIPRRIV